MKSLLAMVCCVLLAACGQTGPLYLPDQAPPKKGLSIRPDTRSPAEESAAQNPLPAKPAAPQPPPAAASSTASPPNPSRPNS
jgi:predicted small lipoprotein YifL